jgi:hypothetical protein
LSSIIQFGSLAFSILFISACANTNIAPYTIPESDLASPSVSEVLDIETPEAALIVDGQRLVFSRKYFSALGKPCLQYESPVAKHLYCYDDNTWSEFSLGTIAVGEF